MAPLIAFCPGLASLKSDRSLLPDTGRCRLAANPSKLPFFLAVHDHGRCPTTGRSHIDWNALRADVLGSTPLASNIAKLTRSGHVALGVSTHVGQCVRVREWDFVIKTFLETAAFK